MWNIEAVIYVGKMHTCTSTKQLVIIKYGNMDCAAGRQAGNLPTPCKDYIGGFLLDRFRDSDFFVMQIKGHNCL